MNRRSNIPPPTKPPHNAYNTSPHNTYITSPTTNHQFNIRVLSEFTSLSSAPVRDHLPEVHPCYIRPVKVNTKSKLQDEDETDGSYFKQSYYLSPHMPYVYSTPGSTTPKSPVGCIDQKQIMFPNGAGATGIDGQSSCFVCKCICQWGEYACPSCSNKLPHKQPGRFDIDAHPKGLKDSKGIHPGQFRGRSSGPINYPRERLGPNDETTVNTGFRRPGYHVGSDRPNGPEVRNEPRNAIGKDTPSEPNDSRNPGLKNVSRDSSSPCWLNYSKESLEPSDSKEKTEPYDLRDPTWPGGPEGSKGEENNPEGKIEFGGQSDPNEPGSLNPIERGSQNPSGPGSLDPSERVSLNPCERGSLNPSERGSLNPSERGSLNPSERGSLNPSERGSLNPSECVSLNPSERGSLNPSEPGSLNPSERGSLNPSERVSLNPSERGSLNPSERGSLNPSERGSLNHSGGPGPSGTNIPGESCDPYTPSCEIQLTPVNAERLELCPTCGPIKPILSCPQCGISIITSHGMHADSEAIAPIQTRAKEYDGLRDFDGFDNLIGSNSNDRDFLMIPDAGGTDGPTEQDGPAPKELENNPREITEPEGASSQNIERESDKLDKLTILEKQDSPRGSEGLIQSNGIYPTNPQELGESGRVLDPDPRHPVDVREPKVHAYLGDSSDQELGENPEEPKDTGDSLGSLSNDDSLTCTDPRGSDENSRCAKDLRGLNGRNNPEHPGNSQEKCDQPQVSGRYDNHGGNYPSDPGGQGDSEKTRKPVACNTLRYPQKPNGLANPRGPRIYDPRYFRVPWTTYDPTDSDSGGSREPRYPQNHGAVGGGGNATRMPAETGDLKDTDQNSDNHTKEPRGTADLGESSSKVFWGYPPWYLYPYHYSSPYYANQWPVPPYRSQPPQSLYDVPSTSLQEAESPQVPSEPQVLQTSEKAAFLRDPAAGSGIADVSETPGGLGRQSGRQGWTGGPYKITPHPPLIPHYPWSFTPHGPPPSWVISAPYYPRSLRPRPRSRNRSASARPIKKEPATISVRKPLSTKNSKKTQKVSAGRGISSNGGKGGVGRRRRTVSAQL